MNLTTSRLLRINRCDGPSSDKETDSFHAPMLNKRNMSSISEEIQNTQKELDARAERQELQSVALQSSMDHLKLERDELKALGELFNH